MRRNTDAILKQNVFFFSFTSLVREEDLDHDLDHSPHWILRIRSREESVHGQITPNGPEFAGDGEALGFREVREA